MATMKPREILETMPPDTWSVSDAKAVWRHLEDVVEDAANERMSHHDEAVAYLGEITSKEMSDEVKVLLKLILDEMPSARAAVPADALAEIDAAAPLAEPLILNDPPHNVSQAYTAMNVVI